MYSWLYRSVLFPLYETHIRRRHTLEYLQEIERNQWLSGEELREIQWSKLQRLLQHVYMHVPYYRRRFAEIGAHPSDIKNLTDFARFPLLAKRDVQNSGNDLVADNYVGKNVVQNETSGSTGQPLVFFYPRESYERRIATRIRSESWIGLEPGMKTSMLWGRYIYPSGLKGLKESLYWRSQRIQRLSAYQLDDDSLVEIIRNINSFRPRFIVSYVTPLYFVSKLAMERGIQMHAPAGVLACAETLYPHQEQLIAKCFNTNVYNRYGCCEVMNIAAECQHKKGMHINVDSLVVEFVRPDGYGDNDIREVVVTDLHNYGMPFIRYRLGDIAKPLSEERCSCGRGLPRMEVVQGRTNNVILTPDGRRVPDHLFLYIFAELRGIRRYQVVQKQEASLKIVLVTDPQFSQQEEQKLLQMAHEILGDAIEITTEHVNDIPVADNAKFRYTVSAVTGQGSACSSPPPPG